MNSEDDFKGPLNLCNPVESTISEIAQMIIKITGSNSKIINKPLPEDDPKQRQPEIGLAINNLAWKPQIHIEKGLQHTIEYFSNLKN